MSPDTFIEDFERTEHSDFLHGVIGRSLIIATRFDSMCTSLSKALDIKQIHVISMITDENFSTLVDKAISKYRTLNTSIKSFQLPSKTSTILHNARKARNQVAHSLAKGLEGCIDTKINDKDIINEISRLIKTITEGDVLISSLISTFNKEPVLNGSTLSNYNNQVLNWVIKE